MQQLDSSSRSSLLSFCSVLSRINARRIGTVLCFLCAALTSPDVAAEGSEQETNTEPRKDVAAAEVLFQKGRQAMDAGNYEAARESFQESLRLDPGAGTVMNLATCEEKLNLPASAWEHWQHALRLLDEGDRRRAFVEKRINELEGELPHLTIRPAKGVGRSIQIERNGVVLGSASWGVALPVDPGLVSVVVRSENHESRTYDVRLGPGERQELLVSPGKALPRAPTDLALSEPNSTRTWGFVATGAGVFGLGLAGVTAALLPGTKNTVDKNCPELRCNQEGWSAVREGKTLVALNTIGFVAGGVGLGTGVTLLLLSGGKKEEASALLPADVWVSSTGAGVSYGRAF